MSASQPAEFNLQEFSDLGVPLAGGRLYTYAFGTTTQKNAFTDIAGAVPHTYTSDGIGGQYIALNSRGELPAPLYLANGPYDLALKTAAGATIWTRRAQGALVASNIVPVQLASAATVDIGGQGVTSIEVTGNTNISSFGTNYAGPIFVRFLGSLTLTHNATTLAIPGGVDATIQAGDIVIASGNTNNNGWNVLVLSQSAFAKAGANVDITSLSGLTAAIQQIRQIQPITASVAANAMTISAGSIALEFRSATLGSGAVTFLQGTPANLVIPSLATLGTLNAQQSRLIVLAINNAGVIELAVINIAGGNSLTETGLISTSSISAASTSSSVAYSTTARASVPYRVIGFVESTQSTAGTWATPPSTIQGSGGHALASMSSFGYGQRWQTVTRASGTTYYNTTGKPIKIRLQCNVSSTPWDISLTVDGVQVARWGYSTITGTGIYDYVEAEIPPGSAYSYLATGLSVVATELR